jgi:hypothetical protein
MCVAPLPPDPECARPRCHLRRRYRYIHKFTIIKGLYEGAPDSDMAEGIKLQKLHPHHFLRV